jgi:hypothetical protein
MLEHHRDAILNRVVAATPIAMQPCVPDGLRTGSHRVMAHRANKDSKQGLGEHLAGHFSSVDAANVDRTALLLLCADALENRAAGISRRF